MIASPPRQGASVDSESTGIKTIQISAVTRYPVVSAYEFDFIKDDPEVQDLLRPCTLYLILQRPLLTINSLVLSKSRILTFEISDGSPNDPLVFELDPVKNGLGTKKESVHMDVQLHKDPSGASINDVAGIKFLDDDGTFITWMSPQKFIHHYLNGSLKANVTGDPSLYIDYRVHYIGKAFSMDVWKRLNPHHKLQSVLIREGSQGTNPVTRPSFEISLLMLNIDGFTEGNLMFSYDFMLGPEDKPIPHPLVSEEDFEAFNTPRLGPNASELTTEAEAILVRQFKPAYNETLFNNYPNLEKGTRSAGYTKANLVISNSSVILYTDHCRLELSGI